MAQKLLGLGDNTVDTYVDRSLQFPGGNAVNVAVQAKRLGAQTGYLGCLGSDEAGMLLVDALRLEGVDTTRCRVRPGASLDRGGGRSLNACPAWGRSSGGRAQQSHC